MMPFTHALLSQYAGASREVVTQHMNRFREQGYVSYSRHGIFLYRDALKASISELDAVLRRRVSWLEEWPYACLGIWKYTTVQYGTYSTLLLGFQGSECACIGY